MVYTKQELLNRQKTCQSSVYYWLICKDTIFSIQWLNLNEENKAKAQGNWKHTYINSWQRGMMAERGGFS